MLASSYKQYMYLSRPVSRRHPMDVGHRAKQFAPFAALRGLEETLQKQEIIYEFQKDLSEEKKNELDMKLRILEYGMKIQVTFFARMHIAKLNGRICGAKRPHSVSEQPNCYQSV